MDTKKISETGGVLTNNRDINILASMKIGEVIESDYPVITSNLHLGDLVEIISKSSRNVFPVVDVKNKFTGLIWLDDIRDILFKTEKYQSILVKDLVSKPKIIISPKNSMETVMSKFDDSDFWVLPVVDKGNFIGFISKSNVFSKYREKLKTTIIE